MNLSPARPLRVSVTAEAGRLSQGLQGSNPHLCKAGQAGWGSPGTRRWQSSLKQLLAIMDRSMLL